jgi:hypothetical protein
MAAGDVLLDADGNVLLGASDSVLLDDGTDDPCGCCGCPAGLLDAYTITGHLRHSVSGVTDCDVDFTATLVRRYELGSPLCIWDVIPPISECGSTWPTSILRTDTTDPRGMGFEMVHEPFVSAGSGVVLLGDSVAGSYPDAMFTYGSDAQEWTSVVVA